MTALVYAAAIGTALVAGIFFAFSTFVMRALGRLDTRAGIAAMQSINVVAINPWFLTVFFGVAVLCITTIVLSFVGGSGLRRAPVLTGAALYLFGCILVTIAGNVPLNDRLARVDANEAEAVDLWELYLVRWTRWNHVRTAASLAAASAFAVAAGTV